MFSLIYARINGWVKNGEAGDLRRYRVHYDVIVILVLGHAHRSTTAQDFVGVMSGVPLALPSYYIQIKESQSLTGRLSKVQADTSGVDWSERSVGKSRIFQSIADVNDVIFIKQIKQIRNLQAR